MIKHLVESSGCVRAPALRYGLPLVIYFFPLLAMYAVSGMETPLYVCAVFFLMVRSLRSLDWPYYLAAALVLLCRPDGVIPIAAAAGYFTICDWKIHWRMVLLLMAIGLGYTDRPFVGSMDRAAATASERSCHESSGTLSSSVS